MKAARPESALGRGGPTFLASVVEVREQVRELQPRQPKERRGSSVGGGVPLLFVTAVKFLKTSKLPNSHLSHNHLPYPLICRTPPSALTPISPFALSPSLPTTYSPYIAPFFRPSSSGKRKQSCCQDFQQLHCSSQLDIPPFLCSCSSLSSWSFRFCE